MKKSLCYNCQNCMLIKYYNIENVLLFCTLHKRVNCNMVKKCSEFNKIFDNSISRYLDFIE